MNTRLIIPLLCAGALALAGNARVRSDRVTAKPALLAATLTPTTTIKKRGAKPAVVKLSSAFGVHVEPSHVRFALNVTNVGSKHVELAFPSGQAYDFVVVDSLGREVWRWAKGRMFTQAMQTRLLGSGDAYRVDEQWNQPAMHGRYVAIATLNSTNYPVRERVEFELR